MNKKQPSGSSKGLPEGLPEEFFDSNKKSKKAQEDDLAKELEQFEREMAALQEESEEQLKEEFDKLQDEKNLEELDQQIDQWKRILELEKKAEELRNKPISENPTKKFKNDVIPKTSAIVKDNLKKSTGKEMDDDDQNLDDIEDFEDKLLDWRSKGI